MHQGPLCNETKFVVLSEFEVTERQISSYFLAVYYLNGETASLTVCPNGKQKCPMVSSVPIDDLPFTPKKPIIYQKRLVQPNHVPTWRRRIANGNKHIFSGEFGWKLWTTFPGVPFTSKISHSLERKLSYHLHSEQYFPNCWVNSHLMSFNEIWYTDSAKWVWNKMCLGYDKRTLHLFLQMVSCLLQTTAERKCFEMIKRLLGW